LLVFARKPAPVQVCWLGYPGSTGLETVDYRFTEPYMDPPGSAEEHPLEEPIRLPHCILCLDPPEGSPPVNPLPALNAGRVTFGSLNNFYKVNDEVIALWSRVLRVVDGSHLLMLSREGGHRDRTAQEFQRHGVEADRIEWFAPAAEAAYLAAYHRIDLGLDTVPYNGHTTSLDSAWMGVPVVTLVGKTIVGRVGLSHSMNLGLPELVATSPDQFVQIARDLAGDLPRLGNLRATLRERMEASPLMNTVQFTRDVEAAYREMWRRWCTK
jgi:predicted O-linked N-acetylglucosamine transferase (SPINDLY family)